MNLYCTHTLPPTDTPLIREGEEEEEGEGNTLNQSTINTLPDMIAGGEGEEIEIDPYLTHQYTNTHS